MFVLDALMLTILIEIRSKTGLAKHGLAAQTDVDVLLRIILPSLVQPTTV